jgi:hypothetical protein
MDDPDTPPSERSAEIAAAAAAGDARAVGRLTATADAGGIAAREAAQALAGIDHPQARTEVRRLAAHGDPGLALAAMRALGRRGAAAVPDIESALAANRRRADGFEEPVCAAGIEALADTQAVAAVAPLSAALAAIQPDSVFSYAFAEKVIDAMVRLGHAGSVPALSAHIARLQRDRDQMTDNPMGQASLDQQIRLTQTAIDRLQPAGRPQP